MELGLEAFGAAFFVFFALYYFVFPTSRGKVRLLLLGSVLFYLAADRVFFPLLLAISGATFLLGFRIHGAKSERARTAWTLLALACALLPLIYFKVRTAANASFLLPLGLSYYSFQAMGYVCDIYRRSTAPLTGFGHYFVSLGLFTHVTAGPIARTAELAPQLDSIPAPEWDRMKLSILLVANGLFKKSVGDFLAMAPPDYFSSDAALNPLVAWTGLLIFSARLYADFSGYSDIAIGLALALGLKLPENFRLPYLASTPGEFWRRWHISLWGWLHQYIFLPILVRANASPFGRSHLRGVTALSSLLVMALVGLWHGAGWGYFYWGVFNGILVLASPPMRDLFARIPFGAGKFLAVATTFYLISIGRVLIVTDSMAMSGKILKELHGSWATAVLTYRSVALLALALLALAIPHAIDYVMVYRREALARSRSIWAISALLLLTLALALGGGNEPFLYSRY